MKTIRLRLAVVFMTVVLVALGIILILHYLWLTRYLIDDKAAQLEDQLAAISQFSEVFVQTPENLPVVANSLLQQFAAFVSGDLAIFDSLGSLVASDSDYERIFWHISDPDDTGSAGPSELGRPAAGQFQRAIIQAEGSRWLVVTSAIGSQPLGYVTQAFSLAETDRSLAATQLRLVYSILLALAGAGIISLVLSSTLTKPLLQMRDTALALAKGDLSKRLSSTRQDEVGELSRGIDHMADEIQRMLISSEENRRRLSAILSSLSEGLLAIDGQGIIRLANPAAARLFNEQSNRLVGRTADGLLPMGRMESIISAALNAGGLYAHELEWPFRPDTAIRITCVPWEVEGGQGLIITLRNVTDLRKLEEKRQEYISRLSHELRTPLTIIKGYLITLLDTPPEELPAETGTLQTLDRETDRLTRMVEELLEASRQRSAVLSLNISPGRLDEVIRESMEGLANHAARQQIKLHVSLPAAMPLIPISRDHIKQVMLNLLDNAIKYNDPGGNVFVTAEVNPDNLAVTVRDDGHGIASEHLPFIFGRYYRASDQDKSGSGLGLAIVKEIIEAHGGEIDLASGSEGSTIRFMLPR